MSIIGEFIAKFSSSVLTILKSALPVVRDASLSRTAERMAAFGSWEFDMVTHQLYGNDAFYAAVGIARPPRGRMGLEQFLAFVHPNDHSLINRYRRTRVKGSLSIDFRIIRNDGEIRWMHAQMQEKNERSCVGIVQDCTDVRNLEAEARLANGHLLAFIERHIDPVVIWNAEGCVVRVNHAFTVQFGFTEEEVVGNCIDKSPFIPDEYRKELEEQSERAIEEATAATIDTIRRKKDGTLLNIKLSITPMVGRDGRVGTWIAILRDYTDQLEANRRLKEAQEELERFVEHNTDAIGFFASDGTVRKVNAAFERMFGWSFEELRTEPQPVAPFSSGYTPAEIRHHIERFIRRGGFQSKEMQGLRKDGSTIATLVSLTPFMEQDGFALMVKDVTELKEARDMLGRSEMLSVIGQLAAGVAHEIKNPLTSLKGFTRLLEPGLADREHRYVSIMKEELDRIELIVNEMLVLSKPQVMELEMKSPHELLNYVIELLGTQAIMKSIEIVKRFEPVPDVECEERQLKQVFVNLLKNAIEAMEDSGKIHVAIGMDGSRSDRIVIRIADQGKGIAPDQLARLTEPFYTTKEKGTGLGLMVTASIIERHGGTIKFESEVGVGTVVTVSLPVQPARSEQQT